ncbi:MAG: ribosomal RNA small subunit methyltransferase A [Gemmatimonadaceae bacterium]|nr:ribosomal RNA small subunit methyltransferase A [Gemmatimonadaceae bacterium]
MPQRPSLPPARKRLGQHFLTDRTALERIVQAVDPRPGETIVEIGPGRGALTDLLAQRAERLVCVEVDPLLVPVLRARYADRPHVSIVEGDVLDVELPSLAPGAWALVGNVPYYITTPIIFQALRSPRPLRMVFLVQREVAERVAAPPGSEAYGALSVNVQALASAEVVARVPAGAFHPRPKVDSAILRLVPRPDPVVRPDEEAAFARMVQAAFGQRRKQMRRVVRELFSLGAAEAEALLAKCAIDVAVRPETLSSEEFARVLRAGAAVKG